MSVDVVMNEKYSVACTKIEEYKCTWTYQVPRNNIQEVEERMDSPSFFTGRCEWDIEVYFGGFNVDSRDYVSCRPYLRNEGKMSQNFEVTITLCILGENDREHFKQTLTRKIDNNAKESCFDRFVKRDHLLSSSTFLINDQLELLCKFSYGIGSINQNHFSRISDESWSTLKYRNVQMSNYKKIFDNPEYSDFELKVGNTKFKVHKCVLAAHSPIFATMFQTDMLEKSKNEADIEDVEVNVMKQLLRFIYIGKVENIDEMADKLFIAADKYEVLHLKELCEEKLLQQLGIGNLCEILQFVDKFDTTVLKDAAIKFIVSNSEKLSAMDGFEESIQSLSSVLLARIVCASLRKTE